jgi:hypothetical protein
MNAAASGTGFLTKRKRFVVCPELLDSLLDCLGRIDDFTNKPNLITSAIGNRHSNDLLMHIWTNLFAKLFYDLPS